MNPKNRQDLAPICYAFLQSESADESEKESSTRNNKRRAVERWHGTTHGGALRGFRAAAGAASAGAGGAAVAGRGLVDSPLRAGALEAGAGASAVLKELFGTR